MKPTYPLTQETYDRKAIKKFKELIKSFPNREPVFQKFFEQNPSFIPGSRSELSLSPSGHDPYLKSVISQPKIRGVKKRSPDFLWLSSDSISFCPVFIEIEAPSKKYFLKKDGFTAPFNHSLNQLNEWQTILTKPEALLNFYDDFNIPQSFRKMHFEPQFVLVYGQRKEYQNNEWLEQQRAKKIADCKRNNIHILCYDNIKPQCSGLGYICTTVKKKKYSVKYISPTFSLNTIDIEEENPILNWSEAINKMELITNARKKYLFDTINEALSNQDKSYEFVDKTKPPYAQHYIIRK
jgi:hypothetical protein